MLGAQAVGKSSLFSRFQDGSFDPNCPSTVGLAFQAKTIELDAGAVSLCLWDMGGGERFRSMFSVALHDASCVILVYDVVRRASFSELPTWSGLAAEEAARRGSTGTALAVVLVANKVESAAGRDVSREEGEGWAAELQANFFQEVDCQSGAGVAELFERIARLMLERSTSRIATIVAASQEGSELVVACVSGLSGEALATVRLAEGRTTCGDIRAALAGQLRAPERSLRLLLQDGRLLEDDSEQVAVHFPDSLLPPAQRCAPGA